LYTDREGALSLVKPLLEDLKPSEVQLDTLMHIWIEGGATDAHLAPNSRGMEVSAWEKWTSAMERMYNRSSTDVSSTCVDYGKLMVQLPEYVKQALEHGSFSKVHSIRSLAQTLAQSQTHATLLIEKARFNLLNGDISSKPKDLREMSSWKEDEMEDTRNWELMPAIGGLRTSVGDLTRLVVDKPGELKEKAAILASFDGGSTTESAAVCPPLTLYSDTDRKENVGG
jgi:N-terminal acetyltransferase B complex non-catalytic subunit